jgi:glycosyltransferase involved in cell wall biosynthesis
MPSGLHLFGAHDRTGILPRPSPPIVWVNDSEKFHLMDTKQIGELTPRVSVIMPTFQQAGFLPRALDSLYLQALADWELIIIVDGSPDETYEVVERYLFNRDPSDTRLQYPRLGDNQGLGAALNLGLSCARASLIAYLPSDDVYDPEHLARLAASLEGDAAAVLAYSGVRHHGEYLAGGQIDGYPLQLVQVMHRATDSRWMERDELTTDDLHRMFWQKLESQGNFLNTGRVTCEWVSHPHQRHKVIREDLEKGDNPYLTSGLNPYRSRYQVQQPLRFHSSVGNLSDEVTLYERFRQRLDTPPAADGLKILLVGELAFNPERVLALEEHGHQLFGLWIPNPGSANAVGPLPFGHVRDLPRTNWPEAVRRLQPDVIYALLNWRAVPFAHQVLMNNPGAPFVWHFKEGPFHCRDKGTWRQVVDLHTRSRGQIYSSPEMRDWFHAAVPETRQGLVMVLDGDLPKRDWLDVEPSRRLGDTDGEIHTLMAGRPMGMHPETMAELARHHIHFHVYGEMKGPWGDWFDKARSAAPRHMHQHQAVAQDRWVSEFSRYDAGWLHLFESRNEGQIGAANWDDLNYPARIATYVAAGLPLLQWDNRGHIFATDRLARQRDIGLFFTDVAQLAGQLHDQQRMAELRGHVWRQREEFTFDYHVERLIEFFRQAMSQ